VKVRFLVSSCLLSALTICLAHAQQPPPPQTPVQKPATPTQPSTITPPDKTVGQPVDPNKYLIGAEDVLRIEVWREPDLSGVVGVRPDGKITRPLIGEIQASGITPMQLTKDLIEKLGVYINRPDVTVIVQEVRSKRYYVDGLVTRPGEFPLVTQTKVFEAISKAGGFQEWANKKNIKIIRDGGKEILKFNYNDVTSGKHMEQNIELQNGDHIIVK
jgi:polysaccharide export outer membrane protein